MVPSAAARGPGGAGGLELAVGRDTQAVHDVVVGAPGPQVRARRAVPAADAPVPSCAGQAAAVGVEIHRGHHSLVTLLHRGAARCRGVPQVDGAVRAARGDAPAVAVQGQPEDDGALSLHHPGLPRVGWGPGVDLAAPVPGGQHAARVAGHQDGELGAGRLAQVRLPARGGIPAAQGAVVAGRDQAAALVEPGQPRHLAFVSLQRGSNLAVAPIPDADAVVGAGGGEALLRGIPGYRGDGALVGLVAAELAHGGQVPKAGRAVEAAAEQQLPAAIEGQRGDDVGVARQLLRIAGQVVPQDHLAAPRARGQLVSGGRPAHHVQGATRSGQGLSRTGPAVQQHQVRRGAGHGQARAVWGEIHARDLGLELFPQQERRAQDAGPQGAPQQGVLVLQGVAQPSLGLQRALRVQGGAGQQQLLPGVLGAVLLRLQPRLAGQHEEDRRGHGHQDAQAHGHGQGPVAVDHVPQQLPDGVVVADYALPGLVALQVASDLPRVAIAIGLCARQAAHGHRGQLSGGLAAVAGHGLHRVVRILQPAQLRLGAPTRDRDLARQQPVEDGPQGPDVRGCVHLLAHGLLGGHIGRRAHDDVGGCAAGVEGGGQACLADGTVVHVLIVDRPRQSPVQHHGLAEGAHHDVVGLDVAVDDALAVGEGDGVAEVRNVVQKGQALPEGAGAAKGVAQRTAAHQAHGVVVGALALLAQVVDWDDARVLQGSGDPGFPQEAPRGRPAHTLLHLLDGHHPTHALVQGQEHPAHGSRADDRELRGDGGLTFLVLPEALPVQQGVAARAPLPSAPRGGVLGRLVWGGHGRSGGPLGPVGPVRMLVIAPLAAHGAPPITLVVRTARTCAAW